MFVFFFQAEDGIRDIGVTGVQTCSLPILADGNVFSTEANPSFTFPGNGIYKAILKVTDPAGKSNSDTVEIKVEIGRASCRERVEISVVAVSLKKKIRADLTLSTPITQTIT